METGISSCYIIAEAGVNHDSDFRKALQLIDIAAEAKADAVKFQLFSPQLLVTNQAPTAAYQAKNLNDTAISQQSMLEKLAISQEDMRSLARHCEKRGIDFLCTPFDHESLDFLATHTPMRYLKLASGEITNGPLLVAAARKNMPIILSTGMSNLEEIAVALGILHFGYTHAAGAPDTLKPATKDQLEALQDKVVILHCVSQYPAPIHTINLKAMDTLKGAFGLPTGLSDHSLGVTMPIAAVARGAAVIEKHFTYDTRATGPDHAASLTPEGLSLMVSSIREVETGLGNGEKTCQPEEKATLSVIRRSVVAANAIRKGEVFTEANMACKRPASGEIPPNNLWKLLGKQAKHDYAADDFIRSSELE